jgi:hypothetical protein
VTTQSADRSRKAASPRAIIIDETETAIEIAIEIVVLALLVTVSKKLRRAVANKVSVEAEIMKTAIATARKEITPKEVKTAREETVVLKKMPDNHKIEITKIVGHKIKDAVA